MSNYMLLPDALKDYPFWVMWRSITRQGQDKPSKIPHNPDGEKIDPTDPLESVDFETAVEAASGDFAGIGIQMHEDNDLIAIDLDNVSEWRDDVKKIVAMFSDVGYREFSPSGNGIRIIVKGKLPENSRTRGKHWYGGNVEIYTKERFVTITGDRGKGEIRECTDILANFVAPLNEGGGALVRKADYDNEILHMGNIDVDMLLLEVKAMARRDLEGAKTFVDLYNGDQEMDSDAMTEAMSSISNVTRNIDVIRELCERSENIAGWEDKRTGAPKFERWYEMEMPGLLLRKHEDIEERKEERREEANLVRQANDAGEYIYVKFDGAWFDTRSGIMISKQALNDTYKSDGYTGARDEMPTMGNVLLSDPNTRFVDVKGWMPSPYGSSHNVVYEHDRKQIVNTWRGFQLTPTSGDVQPWLDLLEHLIPDPDERKHVLQRLAFDIQHPDVKCNWHLVMIGIHGAGKDSLLTPIAEIFGPSYSVVGNDEIKSQYDDGFAKRKIIQVSEVRDLAGSALEKIKRRTASEGAKMVTLNIKSEKQIEHPNLWSFVFLTNHKNAMRVVVTERRFFVTYSSTPLDSNEDLKDRYWEWMRNGGPANLFRYLLDLDISGFDPTVLPFRTKAFMDMVEDSQSNAEMDLEAMIINQTHGFDKGLIDVKMIADSIRDRGNFCRPADVKSWMDGKGWKPVEHISTAVKFINGKTHRLPRGLWAPVDSELHELAGKDLYTAVKKLDFEDSMLDD